jgi:hypothetical protein
MAKKPKKSTSAPSTISPPCYFFFKIVKLIFFKSIELSYPKDSPVLVEKCLDLEKTRLAAILDIAAILFLTSI